jgi:hypothetical protein
MYYLSSEKDIPAHIRDEVSQLASLGQGTGVSKITAFAYVALIFLHL